MKEFRDFLSQNDFHVSWSRRELHKLNPCIFCESKISLLKDGWTSIDQNRGTADCCVSIPWVLTMNPIFLAPHERAPKAEF